MFSYPGTYVRLLEAVCSSLEERMFSVWRTYWLSGCFILAFLNEWLVLLFQSHRIGLDQANVISTLFASFGGCGSAYESE